MVGIVYMQDIRYCPYLERYTAALREMGMAFDCIWWERWDQPPSAPLPAAVMDAEARHVFRRPSKMARAPWRKLGDFAQFSRFARRVIAQRKYDKLILLATFPAMVLCDLLLGKYRGKFLMDIRDYSYEDFPPYRLLETGVIDAAALTVISSEGFRDFLPRGRPYVVADNYMDSDLKNAGNARFHKKPPGEPLVLSYMGFIRYFAQNRVIIDRLVDDGRFLLVYHGTGADYDQLLAYRGQLGERAARLKVTGYFDCRSGKRALCEQADIINNYYPWSLRVQRQATTNKAYDGMIYRRPQLVARGTYSQRLVETWGIGCALEAQAQSFADDLYTYYHTLEEEAFNQAAAKALAAVVERNEVYKAGVKRFLSG